MATQNVSEEQLQSQFTYIDAVARLLGDKRPQSLYAYVWLPTERGRYRAYPRHAVRNGLRNDRYTG